MFGESKGADFCARFCKRWVVAAGLVAGLSAPASAGVIIGGTLLNDSGATQLESWLGQGDLDWFSQWYDEAEVGVSAAQPGSPSASSWHAAVDGVGPTVTIYDIVRDDGSHTLIGGYTELDWGAATGYYIDPVSFIFNLTNPEIQYQEAGLEAYSIYVKDNYFATFGGGHDLYGGRDVLATGTFDTTSVLSGYTYSYSYDQSQGQISVAGDTGPAAGDSGYSYSSFYVSSAETFTFAPAANVSAPIPEPASLAIFGLGLLGMGIAGRRRRSI